ncbi:BON domain-containing protein [Flavobacterium sp.]|uniref:BON domain-containing protein n=1 Tax=Flavobacterium sp. TaxID=239 RepID=UPI003264C880
MKSNEDLQKDVLNAITWEPLLNTTEIGVTADGGIITLFGTVDSYAKKAKAEEAAKYVTGVRAIVEKIEVHFDLAGEKTDTEIAAEILNVFKWHWDIPNENIGVKVENGWVTLEGEIEWNYQKQVAKQAVSNLLGIKGIINNIMIRPKLREASINVNDIESALWRNATIDHNGIKVIVTGDSKVTLSGAVQSLHQKEEASRIVWSAPGVLEVDNQLTFAIAE